MWEEVRKVGKEKKSKEKKGGRKEGNEKTRKGAGVVNQVTLLLHFPCYPAHPEVRHQA